MKIKNVLIVLIMIGVVSHLSAQEKKFRYYQQSGFPNSFLMKEQPIIWGLILLIDLVKNFRVRRKYPIYISKTTAPSYQEIRVLKIWSTL